jgi:stage II sporulation protein D
MNNRINVLFLLYVSLIGSSYVYAASAQQRPPLSRQELALALQKLKLDIPIRVLLAEKSVSDKTNWLLESAEGFLVVAPKGKKTFYKTPKLSLSSTSRAISINGKPLEASHIFIIPCKDTITYAGVLYEGILALTKLDQTLYLVNHIELEDYSTCVAVSEMWPGWDGTVVETSILLHRTYGMAKVLEQRALYAKRGLALPYDIKNTPAHQVYKGCAQSQKFKKLAEKTKGIVLAHKNQPILAMFDICCGGVIPARKKGIDFSKAPYLARPYACSYCKHYKFYSWEVKYTLQELEAHLKKELKNVGALKDIKITRQDGAGIAQEISVHGSRRLCTLSAAKFKSLLKEIKSLCFTLQKKGKQIAIQGKGFGHLTGLCQHGAHTLAQKGWNYKNILKFYYPHTSFMKLKKTVA